MGRGPAAALVTSGSHPVAVDLGTGSGAIAKALATEVPVAPRCTPSSSPPTRWSGLVATWTGTTVTLHAEDLAHALPELNGAVDLVIANPPYIPLGGVRLGRAGGPGS